MQDAQEASLFAPFTHVSGIHLQVSAWGGKLEMLQKRAATGGETWDVILMDAAALQVACQQGLLLPRPLTRDPDDLEPDGPAKDCGVPAWRMNLVLAWDRSRVDITPTWSDFWNVAQHPGKRGLSRSPRGTLEIALMADGVAPADVYTILSTPAGVDRAFRKLDQLKPYIVWWDTPAQAVQIIGSGAVLMTSAPAGEVGAADRTGHRNFGVQWAQSLAIGVEWAVPATTTPMSRALAQRLLAFVSDPAQEAAFSSNYLARPDPSAAVASRATLSVDDDFWRHHLPALQRSFDLWVGAK